MTPRAFYRLVHLLDDLPPDDFPPDGLPAVELLDPLVIPLLVLVAPADWARAAKEFFPVGLPPFAFADMQHVSRISPDQHMFRMQVCTPYLTGLNP